MKAHLLFIVSFCLTIQTSVCQIITNGVIAYYTFDGDANDHSGNNRNPTNQALPSYSLNRLGQNSKALFLDNSNTAEAVCYIEYPATAFSLTGAFSFSLWFARDGGYINPRLFEIGVDGCGINAGFDGTAGLVFYTKCQGIKVPVPITNGQWYHLAGTYDGTSSMKLYLNGQLIGEKNDVTGSAVYDTPFNVGRKPTPYHDGYKGKLDDLVFYNRVLSGQEIATIAEDNPVSTNPGGSTGVGEPATYVSLVRNLCPEANGGTYRSYTNFIAMDSYLYYNVTEYCGADGIYRTDGTALGTNQVSGNLFDWHPYGRCVSGGHLYYGGNYGGSGGLRRINGITGADELVKEGISTPRYMTSLNGILLFTDNGTGLWRSDGTEQGTYQIASISNIVKIVSNSRYAYLAVNGSNNLWQTDGTAEGTVNLGINGPDYEISVLGTSLTTWNDNIYCTYYRNGTGVPYGFAKVQDGQLNFIAAGCYIVNNQQRCDAFVNTQLLFPTTNGLYFIAQRADTEGNVFYSDIWKSDGTTEGTYKVTTLANGMASVSYYFRNGAAVAPQGLEGIFFFPVEDAEHGIELWRSDGTAAGTYLLKDIFPGANGSYPREMSIIDGICYFMAYNQEYGSELWRSDGTTEGTTMVQDLNPGEGSGVMAGGINEASVNMNSWAAAHKGRYYFGGYTQETGVELYGTKGNNPVVVTAHLNDNLGWCDHCEKDLFKVSSLNDKNRYMAYTMGDALTASAGKFDVSWNESIWKGQYSEKTTFTGATWASNPTFTINGLNTSPKPPCSGWSRGFSMSGDCTIPTLSVITPSGGPVIDVASIVTIASVNSKNTYEIPVTGGAPGQKVRIVWNNTLSKWELILIDPSMRTASEIVLSTNQGDQRSNPLCAGWTNGYGLAGDVCNSLPLPVKLISFNASVENSSVILNWKTSEESNSLYYAIERSKNMKIFEQVAQLDAAGNTQNLSTYTHTDENPLKGISYYRLRQVDNDGKVMLSRTVSVRISGSNVPYPNPTDGYAIRVKASDLRKLTLTDVTGKNVPFDARRLDGEIFEILPKTRLTSGLYIMRCDGASYKFIVN